MSGTAPTVDAVNIDTYQSAYTNLKNQTPITYKIPEEKDLNTILLSQYAPQEYKNSPVTKLLLKDYGNKYAVSSSSSSGLAPTPFNIDAEFKKELINTNVWNAYKYFVTTCVDGTGTQAANPLSGVTGTASGNVPTWGTKANMFVKIEATDIDTKVTKAHINAALIALGATGTKLVSYGNQILATTTITELWAELYDLLKTALERVLSAAQAANDTTYTTVDKIYEWAALTSSYKFS